MKTILKTVLICNLAFNISFAQNIGINGSGATAHPSALLDIDAVSTPSLGILIPRIALQAINVAAPVAGPATSLLVYNTASASTGTNAVSAGYYYWDAVKWVRFAYNANGSSSTGWDLLGNTGTTAGTNFLGTTDAKDLVFKTNNLEAVRINTVGNVGIGTSTPSHKLSVFGTIKVEDALGNPIGFAFNNATKFDIQAPSTSTGLRMGTSAGSPVTLYTGGTDAVTIVAGNVGINTATPANKLEITHGTAGNSGLRFTNLPNASALSTNSLGDVLPATAITATNNGVFWGLVGNAGTTAGTNFLGTTDAKDLVFKTNNLEAMRISTAGNVGVGSSAPIYKLHVTSTDPKPNGNLYALYVPTFTANVNATTNINGVVNYLRLASPFNISSTVSGLFSAVELMATQTGSVSQIFGSYSSVFSNTNTAIGNIKSVSASYHKVSHTTPSVIESAHGLLSTVLNTGAGSINNAYGLRISTVDGINKWSVYASDSSANSYFAAKVGVGLAPQYKLHVYNNDPNSEIATYSRNTPSLTANSTSNYYAGLNYLSLNSSSNFGGSNIASMNRLNIDSLNTGAVTGLNLGAYNQAVNNGITNLGTMAGSYNRAANYSSGAITEAIGVFADATNGGTGTITNGYGVKIGSINGTNKWSLYAQDATAPSYFAGNVGVGLVLPAYKLDVVGDINASGEVRNSGVILTSDARLKKDVLNIENGLDNIMKLRPVSYFKKETLQSNDYNHNEIGFIAQEVEKIFPQLISKGKDSNETLGLNYIGLIPVLTKAVQEIETKYQQKFDTQQQQIEFLMKEIELLKKK